MQHVNGQSLPVHPSLQKQTKPLIITGTLAVVASVISTIAIIIFAAPLIPILLPVTATIAAAGVICLSIGLHALRMHAKQEDERNRKVAELKDHILKKDIDGAAEAFDALPQENQQKTFEDLANSFLETSNEDLKWLLLKKKETLQPNEKLTLCVKLIERHKEKAPFKAIRELLNTLDIPEEKQKELHLELCNYYMQQNRFDEAFEIVDFYELMETAKPLFEEFLKLKNVPQLERIIRLYPHDAKVVSSWRCKLAALYVELNEMEKAMELLNPLQLAPKINNPEFKLYEIVQIRLYSHFKADAEKAKRALESVAFSLGGGFEFSDGTFNYSSAGFSMHLEKNLPPAFLNCCEQAKWEEAHQVLAQAWEAYKNPPVVKTDENLPKKDDPFDDW